MVSREKLFVRAQVVDKESKQIEFKERFDIDSARDWCEIVKDVVAMANSGGGCILIGVKDDGTPSEFDLTNIMDLDPAQLTDKIAKYTGQQFSGFEVKSIDRRGCKGLVLFIDGVPIPMVFIKPGSYEASGERHQVAFREGTVYFRHGAKSEPGDTSDLRDAIERELRRFRQTWLSNIKKVVIAPSGYTVQSLPSRVSVSSVPTTPPVRITDSLEAPAFRLETPDDTHPYRQKEVVQIVNSRLRGKRIVNSYDILCVRRVHKIDATKPQYYYKSKYGSPQYSEDFINWLVTSYEHDPSFFDEARQEYGKLVK